MVVVVVMVMIVDVVVALRCVLNWWCLGRSWWAEVALMAFGEFVVSHVVEMRRDGELGVVDGGPKLNNFAAVEVDL